MTTKPYKIGLSLSLCVHDIIQGKVDEDQVMFIVSGTHIKDFAVDKIIDIARSYMTRGHLWDECQIDEAAKIMLHLRATGKLHQPREHTHDIGSPFSFHGFHWLDVIIPPAEDSPIAAAYDHFITMAALTKDECGVFQTDPPTAYGTFPNV
jgi:hypothetical protein